MDATLGINMKVFILFLLCISQSAFADLSVIVHRDFSANTIELHNLRSIYSGDNQHINDLRIIPLDQQVNSDNYTQFYDAVLNRPMEQIISHWSKLIFTGKGQAPISLAGDMSIIKFVESNPNAIGYIDSKYVTDTVKVIQTIKIRLYKELKIESLKNR